MRIQPVEMVDCGLDWCTFTAPNPNLGLNLASHAEKFIRAEELRGCIMRPWTMAGYEGFNCGQVAAGIRAEGGIVRLSGSMAQRHWKEFYDKAKGCSRFDAQVTYRYADLPGRVIAAAFNGAHRKRKRDGRGATVSIWREAGGASTLYLGKRVSNRFGRVYDKGAESGLACYANCVRWELEVKGNMAWSNIVDLAQRTEQFADDECQAAQKTIIHAWLMDYFGCRGILPESTTVELALVTSASVKSDLHRRLDWLRTQVRPTVESIASLGFAADVFTTLFQNVPGWSKLKYAPTQSLTVGPEEIQRAIREVNEGGEYVN